MRNKLLSLLLLTTVGQALADWSITFHPTARYVLPSSAGPALLRQCSRFVPSNVSEYWQPSSEQIRELEARLVPYLAKRAAAGAETPPASPRYHRQYVGIVSDGVRLIYGNFFSGQGIPRSTEAKTAVIVCDGGSSFWGVVYDVEAGTIVKVDFNGVA